MARISESMLRSAILFIAYSSPLNAGPIVISGSYELSTGVGLGVNQPVREDMTESTNHASYSLETEVGGRSYRWDGFSNRIEKQGAKVTASGNLEVSQFDGARDVWGSHTGGTINFWGSSFSQSPKGVWAQGYVYPGYGGANVGVVSSEPIELHVAYSFFGGGSLGNGNAILREGGAGVLVIESSPQTPRSISVGFPSGGAGGAIPESPYVSSGTASIVWGVNGLPGLRPEQALKGTVGVLGSDNNENQSVSASEPVVTRFTSPVTAGYGQDTTVFFNTASLVEKNQVFSTFSSLSAMSVTDIDLYEVGDALFVTFGPNFASITLPTAVPDLGLFTLRSGAFEAQVNPGDVFDFTTWHSGGISEFLLLGYGGNRYTVDESSLAAYAVGFTFAEEGISNFTYQLTAVPEPSSVALLLIGAFPFVLGARRRQSSSETCGCGKTIC